MENQNNHRHDFQDNGNYLICSCGKKKLNFQPSAIDGILQATMEDGRKYSTRRDRHRYFFPEEWRMFIKALNSEKHKFLFSACLNTGGRIMEVLHLKPKNFDFNRGTITFDVIKQRKAKRNFYASGKSRTFFVSGTFIREARAYIIKNKIDSEQYIFLDNEKLPVNYSSMDNSQKKQYYTAPKTAISALFKRNLKKAGIKDWRNFSLHNIRKTYANWMRIYDIKLEELCYRLGHDMETFLEHYGSSLIFTPSEKIKIMDILGEVR